MWAPQGWTRPGLPWEREPHGEASAQAFLEPRAQVQVRARAQAAAEAWVAPWGGREAAAGAQQAQQEHGSVEAEQRQLE